MPLVGAPKSKRQWGMAALVSVLSFVLVTGLWGAIVGAAGNEIANFVGNPRTMATIMKPLLTVMGVVLLVIALGELGLIRRLLPEVHPVVLPAAGPAEAGGFRQYRQVAVAGLTLAATFGVICTRPIYLALLVYVATAGGVVAGVLALGAYGLGLGLPIVLGNLALRPANRAARLMDWVAARHEAIHVAQGLAFALLGAAVVYFFGIRYVIPAA
jgi:cytochrome c biogenesis protein CcdA